MLAQPVQAKPVAWDQQDQIWLSQQSEHLSIHFLAGHQQSTANVLDIAERVHRVLLPFFKHTPGTD
ncbi:hypothetical protein [Photobacterium lipolyticum]|uniref:Uncharacterized protein n=1 Tax=Photobacterium lipolyticum TaxID=266810 RepID=A0A2T3MWS3_9GAMM|nr:hypothetical protein [Photobacterium lipolyticum]PSW04351.1 hypothetical protein C9I89_13580 [Photobacterium lipolyticum]